MEEAQRLRDAAREVAEANDDGLPEAVKRLMGAQVDWYNGIPRDDHMVPLAAS